MMKFPQFIIIISTQADLKEGKIKKNVTKYDIPEANK